MVTANALYNTISVIHRGYYRQQRFNAESSDT